MKNSTTLIVHLLQNGGISTHQTIENVPENMSGKIFVLGEGQETEEIFHWLRVAELDWPEELPTPDQSGEVYVAWLTPTPHTSVVTISGNRQYTVAWNGKDLSVTPVEIEDEDDGGLW